MKREELEKKVESLNLEDDFKKIIIENFDEETSFISGNTIAVVQDFGGAHPKRGWDVRIRSSVVHLFNKRGSYRYEFHPYFEYEDFPGGKTDRNPYMEVQKIVSVKGCHVTVKVAASVSNIEKVKCKKVVSTVRKRERGEREKFLDDSIEIKTRLAYEGDPRDFNFEKQPSGKY